MILNVIATVILVGPTILDLTGSAERRKPGQIAIGAVLYGITIAAVWL